jgi:CheY-like chemotaxis protein
MRLRQILVNLVGNAIKFTERGEVLVHVEPEPRSATEIDLHFLVADTGIGIPEYKRRAIFEAFAQVDGSTTRRYGGTGLGLAISSQLVEMMGGRIWVDSELGQGSTFHFTVPLRVPVEPAGVASVVPLDGLLELPVLVVDDNATNRRFLYDLLARWRMRPAAVDSGLAALAHLHEAASAGTPYPLVLLDGHMPDVDGFATAAQIKQSPDLAGTAVIMLTSAGQPGDVTRCRQIGIHAWLLKPIRPSELLETIQATLVRAGEVAVAAAEPGPVTSAVASDALRILLAEDNLINQKLIVRLLEKRGHQVTVAPNGQAAVATIAQETFDVVLMDVQMPDLDGLEATRQIREREVDSGRRLPIIAMTAHAMKGDRERCLAAGMDGYVSKPVAPSELFAAIANVVPRFAAGVAAPVEVPPHEVLDVTEAVERVGGDWELFRDLAQTFLDGVSPRLTALQDAIARRDPDMIDRLAHALKSEVGAFGARFAFQAALQVETLGHSGNLEGIDAAWAVLESEIQRLLPVLSAVATQESAAGR